MKVKNIGLALGLTTFSLVLGSPNAEAMLGWRFSYINQGGDQTSGIFTTDQTNYDPTGNTTYTVQSITGTRTPTVGSPSSIQGPLTIPEIADNTFRWDGNELLVTGLGIAYTTTTADGSIRDFVISADPENPNYQLPTVEYVFDYPNGTNNLPVIQANFIENSSLAPAVEVPFEPSPTQGLVIGLSLFYGLKTMKNKASKKKFN